MSSPHAAGSHSSGSGAGQAQGPARLGLSQVPTSEEQEGLGDGPTASARQVGTQAGSSSPEIRSTAGRQSPTPSTWI